MTTRAPPTGTTPGDSPCMTYARFTKNMNMECHSNRIALTLTETYAESWKTWEGVREFVQNWFDGIYDNLESNPGLKPKFTKSEVIMRGGGHV